MCVKRFLFWKRAEAPIFWETMKSGSILITVMRTLDERNLPSLWKLKAPRKLTGCIVVGIPRRTWTKSQLNPQQLTTRDIEQGAHLMRWSQRLQLAQMRGPKLIQTGDA